jgi:hypothetical protein
MVISPAQLAAVVPETDSLNTGAGVFAGCEQILWREYRSRSYGVRCCHHLNKHGVLLMSNRQVCADKDAAGWTTEVMILCTAWCAIGHVVE